MTGEDEQLGLFEDEPCGALVPIHPQPIGPEPKPLSAGQRLTLRKREMLARGVHPVTRLRLLPAEEQRTCRDCRNRFRHGQASRGYWKCELNATRGPATDVRLSYPACTGFRETGRRRR